MGIEKREVIPVPGRSTLVLLKDKAKTEEIHFGGKSNLPRRLALERVVRYRNQTGQHNHVSDLFVASGTDGAKKGQWKGASPEPACCHGGPTANKTSRRVLL